MNEILKHPFCFCCNYKPWYKNQIRPRSNCSYLCVYVYNVLYILTLNKLCLKIKVHELNFFVLLMFHIHCKFYFCISTQNWIYSILIPNVYTYKTYWNIWLAHCCFSYAINTQKLHLFTMLLISFLRVHVKKLLQVTWVVYLSF